MVDLLILFVFQFMRKARSLFLLALLTKNIINFLFSANLIPYADYYDHRLVHIFRKITLVIQWQTTTVMVMSGKCSKGRHVHGQLT